MRVTDRLGIFVFVIAISLSVQAVASPEPPMSKGDIFRILGEERTLGEQGVLMLRDYADGDAMKLARGRLLYGDARAKFEGVIEQLKVDLAENRDPNASPGFKSALDAAVEKRETFLAFVEQEVMPPVPGPKSPSLVKLAAQLISEVTESAVALWREWRLASSERRAEIERRLDAQKWLPFERIAG